MKRIAGTAGREPLWLVEDTHCTGGCHRCVTQYMKTAHGQHRQPTCPREDADVRTGIKVVSSLASGGPKHSPVHNDGVHDAEAQASCTTWFMNSKRTQCN